MKGYWIARIDVTDEEIYPEYGKRAMPAIAKFGGRMLARGGRATTPEGRDYARNVVIEFASHEQALACYDSPEYQESLTGGHINARCPGRGVDRSGVRAGGEQVASLSAALVRLVAADPQET